MNCSYSEHLNCVECQSDKGMPSCEIFSKVFHLELKIKEFEQKFTIENSDSAKCQTDNNNYLECSHEMIYPADAGKPTCRICGHQPL